ncbi:minor tail protein [Mycobacterium phage Aminay]|uniref:Minor tail protein n=1 Tax=Mycobacterium phage Aminay TaxID=2250291 RepID=A0A345KV06_9CAUD|nr:minor tail protein [Mycobacterium phage Aminay]AXH46858.1 minor tail protein [Mycobacterium phage Aminay]
MADDQPSWMHDDFYLDPILYPNDAYGNPRYAQMNPTHPHWQRMSNWYDLGRHGEYLRSTKTKWVYIHPSNMKLWRLNGPGRGREGVVLSKELDGVLQPEFEIRYSEGPYVIGAIPERVDWKKRRINLGVAIQPNGNAERAEEANPFSGRRIFDSWASSWSEEVPGYLGSFTRTHGWRWLAVTLGEASKTTLSTDPAESDGSFEMNMAIDAPWPFFAKMPLSTTWKASPDDVYNNGVAHGTIRLANRGTWEALPKFIVKGAGTVTIQDGNEGREIKLPELYPTDGAYMLVDTDPTKKTIVTEKDPVDSQVYKYLRNSQLAQIMLHDTLDSKLPAQRRIPGGIGFENPIPPRTVAHLKVTHSNPYGSITAIMPQYYRMAWA